LFFFTEVLAQNCCLQQSLQNSKSGGKNSNSYEKITTKVTKALQISITIALKKKHHN